MALAKPFAVNGNKVSISLNKTDDGVMNYEEGFGERYEQPIKAIIDEEGNVTSTGGLQITRPQFNGLMNELSRAIIENQEKILTNHQHITKVENVMSGCAFLDRNNKFGGLNSFSGVTTFKVEVFFETKASFDTAKFNENPTIENDLSYSAAANNALITKNAFNSRVITDLATYSAQGDDLIITKGALEKQLEHLRKIISGISKFDTLRVRSLEVISATAKQLDAGTARIDTIYAKRTIISSGAGGIPTIKWNNANPIN